MHGDQLSPFSQLIGRSCDHHFEDNKVRYQLINQLWLASDQLRICCQVTALIYSKILSEKSRSSLCTYVFGKYKIKNKSGPGQNPGAYPIRFHMHGV